MSSKPHRDGARRLIGLIRRERELLREREGLLLAVKRLALVEEEIKERHHEFDELLRSMDCESPGNAGWTGRTSWLIAAIIDEIEADRPKPNEQALQDLENTMRSR